MLPRAEAHWQSAAAAAAAATAAPLTTHSAAGVVLARAELAAVQLRRGRLRSAEATLCLIVRMARLQPQRATASAIACPDGPAVSPVMGAADSAAATAPAEDCLLEAGAAALLRVSGLLLLRGKWEAGVAAARRSLDAVAAAVSADSASTASAGCELLVGALADDGGSATVPRVLLPVMDTVPLEGTKDALPQRLLRIATQVGRSSGGASALLRPVGAAIAKAAEHLLPLLPQHRAIFEAHLPLAEMRDQQSVAPNGAAVAAAATAAASLRAGALRLQAVLTQPPALASTAEAATSEARLLSRLALFASAGDGGSLRSAADSGSLREAGDAFGEWAPHFSVPFAVRRGSLRLALRRCAAAQRALLPALRSAQLQALPPSPARTATPSRPFRVGFYSDFFRRHSSCRAFCGALKQLALRARARHAAAQEKGKGGGRPMELVLLLRSEPKDPALALRSDAHTDALFSAFGGNASDDGGATRVVLLPQQQGGGSGHGLQAARRQILAEDLDVLVFGEVGLGSWGYFLAATRLAPTQVAFWGHPFSSGLATVDYFVTSELFLPPREQGDGDAVLSASVGQYVEQHVLFQSLSTFYAPPAKPNASGREHQQQSRSRRREALGLGIDDHAYLVAQSLFKLHPDFDAVLRALLHRDPRAVLLLLQDVGDAPTVEVLLNRFSESLRSNATASEPLPPPHERIVALPKLPKPAFLSLLQTVDVVLDTFPVGGGITSIDAIAQGVAVVTLPSAQMGQCFAAGMLRRIGVENTIAADVDEYVDIAVGLAGPANARRELLGERVRHNSHKLFSDEATVDEWETFLSRLQRGHSQQAYM
jgi:hypothetical protein